MAKASMKQREEKRKKLAATHREKRAQLKEKISNKDASLAERFDASMKLASLPRDGSQARKRNRCALTGRPRGYYRRFKLSRICLRELAAMGYIPGLIKSSW